MDLGQNSLIVWKEKTTLNTVEWWEITINISSKTGREICFLRLVSVTGSCEYVNMWMDLWVPKNAARFWTRYPTIKLFKKILLQGVNCMDIAVEQTPRLPKCTGQLSVHMAECTSVHRGFCLQPQNIKNFRYALYIKRKSHDSSSSVCKSYKTTDFEFTNYNLTHPWSGGKKNTNTLNKYLLSPTPSQTVNKLKLFPMLFPA